MTHYRTDDVRIEQGDELLAPMQVMRELPATDDTERVTFEARQGIHDILRGADDRLLVVVGPCSIHDLEGRARVRRAPEGRARAPRARDLLIVMRVYFEKPRTTVGWKGLINDPHLNDTFDMNEGLRLGAQAPARTSTAWACPAAPSSWTSSRPQYIADLIAWGAIGARTTESQSHRQLASGLSCPVGFKNGTDGNIRIAVDAIKAANAHHHFISVTKSGHVAVFKTAGNEDCHVILRGGKSHQLRRGERGVGLQGPRLCRARASTSWSTSRTPTPPSSTRSRSRWPTTSPAQIAAASRASWA